MKAGTITSHSSHQRIVRIASHYFLLDQQEKNRKIRLFLADWLRNGKLFHFPLECLDVALIRKELNQNSVFALLQMLQEGGKKVSSALISFKINFFIFKQKVRIAAAKSSSFPQKHLKTFDEGQYDTELGNALSANESVVNVLKMLIKVVLVNGNIEVEVDIVKIINKQSCFFILESLGTQ